MFSASRPRPRQKQRTSCGVAVTTPAVPIVRIRLALSHKRTSTMFQEFSAKTLASEPPPAPARRPLEEARGLIGRYPNLSETDLARLINLYRELSALDMALMLLDEKLAPDRIGSRPIIGRKSGRLSPVRGPHRLCGSGCCRRRLGSGVRLMRVAGHLGGVRSAELKVAHIVLTTYSISGEQWYPHMSQHVAIARSGFRSRRANVCFRPIADTRTRRARRRNDKARSPRSRYWSICEGRGYGLATPIYGIWHSVTMHSP